MRWEVLSNLRSLYLQWNELTGPVPSALGRLSSLEELNLGGNGLTGPIPDAVGSLSNLRSLYLHVNELAGPVPSALGRLSNLEELNLGGNGLTGPIPDVVGSLSNLRSLQLYANELSGPVPGALGSLSSLQSLVLDRNALSGPIPGALGSLSNLRQLVLSSNELSGPVPGALGSLSSLQSLNLRQNALTGPVPGALGSLASLENLDLSRNALTGPVPGALGSLASLEVLNLSRNALSGPVPGALGSLSSLRQLSLSRNRLLGELPFRLTNLDELIFFDVSETNVCMPSDPAFQRWRAAIEARGTFLGSSCDTLAGDRAALEALYDETGGPNWTDSTNWKTSAPLAQWHGVTTGADGRVTRLNLVDNGLVGSIPPALGSLVNLEWLNLSWNPLTGELPLSLTNLHELRFLDVSETSVCIPSDPAFRRWQGEIEARGGRFRGASSCDSHAGDRAVLEAFYDATGGTNWTNSTNWKTSAPLVQWHGVTTGADGRVTRLNLVDNGLVGSIPPALGSLVNLEYLGLNVNDLTGPIPDELGNLVNLGQLVLSFNDLTGPVPASLGNLARLRTLYVANNALTGPIPSELGSLANLAVLVLCWNGGLTGPIPSELGNLVDLRELVLQGNRLTGPIPAWLGSLTRLQDLSLHENNFTGPIPGELGNLVNLRDLHLYGNALTGSIPGELESLVNLDRLTLHGNPLTGPIPAWLGNLPRLRVLWLSDTDLTGAIPDELGSLANLEVLDLSGSWGLSGPLPPSLRLRPLKYLDVFLTQACAPVAWRGWLQTIDFRGRLCEEDTDVTIDVAVVYTPAARGAAGGSAEIAAVIDLMVAETNQAYAASGVGHRVALVARSEVQYTESYHPRVDLDRLLDPSDGHLDEVHALRERVGADLVHLIVGDRFFICGIARLSGAFGLTLQGCGGSTFAHELGHNMGLRHDRYEASRSGGVRSYPAYGYVNQRGLGATAPASSRWRTVMSYPDQCDDADVDCSRLLRFSNPRQHYNGDPLGVPFGSDGSGVSGPADAAAVLDATGPAVALWRDRPAGANEPPVAVGTLPDPEMTLDSTLDVDVSPAFVDPDGDALRYTVSSSAPDVVTVLASGSRVTLTAVGAGTAMIRTTATDPGGLSVSQLFKVTVSVAANRPPEPVGALAPLTIRVDEAAMTVEVSGAFRDPDDDALTYGARSSSPGLASVSVSGSVVTVTPVSEGTATVTVTATDAGGLSATQTFPVTVAPPANRPPEAVGTLSPLTLAVDESAVTVEVSGAFRDPDDDPLTYGVMSSSPGVASVSVSGSVVTVSPVSEGAAAVTVTATDTGGSNTLATQMFLVTVRPPTNRPPEPVGALAPLRVGVDEASVTVEVSGAFRDPDGDRLTYAATSSAPAVATAAVSGSTVTVTPVAPGTSTVTVTATDTGGSNTAATQTFGVTVPRPFTDHPIVSGVTPVKAVHFTELRARIDALRREGGLAPFPWTDRVLTAGVTPVRLAHLLELRSALGDAYAAAGRSAPGWTDAAPAGGATPIRAAHLMELRAAVTALE